MPRLSGGYTMRTYAGLALVVLLTACGGGGGGNPNPSGPTLFPAATYFPAQIGAKYVYRSSNMADPLFDPLEGDDITYTVAAGPAGGDVVYNVASDFDTKRSPVFSGLNFTGLVEGGAPKFVTGAADTAQVLPATLTGIGQQWPINLHLGPPGTTFISRFSVTGTATLAAVENVPVGSTVATDCVRVDVSFDYSFPGQPIPGLTGSYWLEPEVGPVLGVCRVAGVEVGRVQLISLTAP
jgi:hypothetical protein